MTYKTKRKKQIKTKTNKRNKKTKRHHPIKRNHLTKRRHQPFFRQQKGGNNLFTNAYNYLSKELLPMDFLPFEGHYSQK